MKEKLKEKVLHDATNSLGKNDKLKVDRTKPFHSQASMKQTRMAKQVEIEDHIVEAIDMRRNIAMVAPILKRLDEGKLDVQGLFVGIAPSMAKKLIQIALNGESEKNMLDATKHLLSLAGHQPSQKLDIRRIDPDSSKQALIALLEGSSQDLKKAGIEIVDDTEED